MLQDQHSPRLQPVPLPPLTPDEKIAGAPYLTLFQPSDENGTGSVPGSEADAAPVLPPTGQSSLLPLISQDDEYQWLILL